ncbi:MAG: EAL domain-containing protein [Chloroflexota bacterium]|nr:EAL domain-containing protein [Chloroflexota bacterium]
MTEHDGATLEVTAVEVRAAFEHGEFVVLYQPIVSLHTGKLLSAEGLVRWLHPRLGTLSPGRFLPVVACAGLMTKLGAWVLQTICARARSWQDAGIDVPCVGFNPSEEQFRRTYLRDLVRMSLDDADLDPQRLTLELHEAVMGDAECASATLQEIATQGVRLWLDDFATGPPHLRNLTRFPFDTLKLDRSYVANIAIDAGEESIVAGSIRLAHALGLEVVAEGVATEAQLAVLRRLGCGYIQGYLLSHPLEADALATFLSDGPHGDIDRLGLLRR